MSDDSSEKKPEGGLVVSEQNTVPGLKQGETPALTRAVQAEIGQRLRNFYDSLALGESPVPDRFIDLLSKLDEKERGRQSCGTLS
jgi:hypothetical protein